MDDQGPSENAPRDRDSVRSDVSSMSALIIWNISKALETLPFCHLEESLLATGSRMEEPTFDVGQIYSDQPLQRHLACALLAWQQMGHQNAESLCKFIRSRSEEFTSPSPKIVKLKEEKKPTTSSKIMEKLKAEECGGPTTSADIDDSVPKMRPSKLYSTLECQKSCASSKLVGPVVMLPTTTRIVMRCENPSKSDKADKADKAEKSKSTSARLEKACCLDSGCIDKLQKLDDSTKLLRSRATQLARREAERVELLERAEAAWTDLENGYRRRLRLALEKEEDAFRQVQKLMDERNSYKDACSSIAETLKKRGDELEVARKKLADLEKKMCEVSCEHLKLRQAAASADAALADEQCRATQLTRDLQFKEEQARRKVQNKNSELDSARALACESERAMRAELSGLRAQMNCVSKEYLDVEAEIDGINKEIQALRDKKAGMAEDLETCVLKCDKNMADKINAVKEKSEKLSALKEKIMECKCKIPMDRQVQVTRTPSFVALCKCNPEDKFLDSCSCTSMRTTLMSNLLSDLFTGLQSELHFTGVTMPCQLLKCLEDKHSWDGDSVVKTNLRGFFSRLLISELDIAIATSIEAYHVRWIGTSCADVMKQSIPDEFSYDLQQKAVERRAQLLANDIAEQMFKDKAQELMDRTKEIMKAGPPPCECKNHPAVLTCLVPAPKIVTGVNTNPIESSEQMYPVRTCSCAPKSSVGSGSSVYWESTIRDVVTLKNQIEYIRKESIKIQDLKKIEDKIAQLVQRVSVSNENDNDEATMRSKLKNSKDKKNIKEKVNEKKETNPQVKLPKVQSQIKGKKNASVINKSEVDNVIVKLPKPYPYQNIPSFDKFKINKKISRLPTYAVNWCLCDSTKGQVGKEGSANHTIEENVKQEDGPDFSNSSSTSEQPETVLNVELNTNHKNRKPEPEDKSKGVTLEANDSREPCKSDCVCLNTIPSNRSIDKLLQTLMKWKCDLKCLANHPSHFDGEEQSAFNVKKNATYESMQEPVRLLSANKSKPINVANTATISQKQGLNNHFSVIAAANEPQQQNNCFSVIGAQPQPLVPNTQSVYMAEVNLDKSNDNICKCALTENTVNTETNTETCVVTQQRSVYSTNQITKSVNTTASAKSNPMEQHAKLSKQVNSGIVNVKNAKTEPIRKVEQKSVNKFFNRASQISHTVLLRENTSVEVAGKQTSIDQPDKKFAVKQLRTSSDVRCACDYEVKFLGVTLHANEDMQVTKEKALNVNINRNKKKRPISDFSQHINVALDQKKLETLQVNHMSLDNSVNKKSSLCVCCPKIDETNDLEVNTFYLLQEHLKNKFTEVKENCRSSCIMPDQEKHALSTTLTKIKKTISEAANQVLCKCADEEPVKCTWGRANELLQEYLKMKINRAQCKCDDVLEKSADSVIPDITAKVCVLIEKDFDQLKKICKCFDAQSINSKLNRQNTFELPERDLNHAGKASKQVSNASFFITHSTSAQVQPNSEMESKACNVSCPYSKQSEILQTSSDLLAGSKARISELNDSSLYQQELIVQSNVADNNNVAIEHLSSDHLKIKSTDNDVTPSTTLENQLTLPLSVNKIVNEATSSTVLENQLTLPLIGYTVNCTCNECIGSCMCSKAIVTKNNKKIEDIWYSLQNKLQDQDKENIAYIMSKIKKSKDKSTEKICLHQSPIPDTLCVHHLATTDNNQQINRDFLDTKSSALDVRSEMVLKYSATDSSASYLDNMTSTKADNYTKNKRCSMLPDTQDLLRSVVQYHKSPHSNYEEQYSQCSAPQISMRSQSVEHLDFMPPQMPQCDCGSVPMCLVKMLVEDIEDKLKNSD